MTPNVGGSWAQRIEAELRVNILPFWSEKTVDHKNGGFYGALTNDLRIDNTMPRSAVLTARILWTFSAAYRRYGDTIYVQTAQRAYAYIRRRFVDDTYGGVYWTVDRHGQPIEDRKHVYAQAFAIYGLAEYYRATGEPAALALAQELFRLVELHSYDPVHGGNVECLSRTWGTLGEMRLSDRDVNSRKSMNTLLHLMEAYTNLLCAWPDPELLAKQRALIEIFLDHVIDPETHHQRLFFDDAWHWQHLSTMLSYGHDIETSWLLVKAAEQQGDPGLLARAQAEAVLMAEAVYRQAIEPDGSVIYESEGHGPQARQKHWWVHAEAVVGFYNAYQISGHQRYADASHNCWGYIQSKFVDRVHGDWFKILDDSGRPDQGHVKVGPWECPYHHGRMCLEMLARLASVDS